MLTFVLVIALFCLGIYWISKNKKWKIVGKVIGILLAFSLFITGCVYGYNWYKNLPYKVSQLGEISLGMKPVEITLLLGKPTLKWIENKGNASRYIYNKAYNALDYYIKVEKDVQGFEKVTLICREKSYTQFFGLQVNDRESKVIKKLGKPTNISINKEGLKKFISYKDWNIAFGIREGKIETICITDSGEVDFEEKYINPILP